MATDSRSGLSHPFPSISVPQSLRAQAAGAILLVAVLSLGIRVFNLLSLPIFLDEVTFLDWGTEIWARRTREALLIPIVADNRQPLFVWLAGAAASLVPDPLFGGRMVSVLSGVASTVGVYLAGSWLVGRQVGLLAAALYALAPFSVFYDRMALMDSLLNAAGVWAFALSVYIAARAGDSRRGALAGAGLGCALGVALWTKMTALFFLGFPFLCALLLARRRKLLTSAVGIAVGLGVFAALALLLFLIADPRKLWDSMGYYAESPSFLLAPQWERWGRRALHYWSWMESYLPAPLCWLVPVAATWGIVRRRRHILLLMGCWAGFTLPIALGARMLFESRYVYPGVFLLILMVAILVVELYRLPRTRVEDLLRRAFARWSLGQLAASALALTVAGASLWFDVPLLSRPESAPLPPSDRSLFVTGWSSGYGFPEALRLVKKRASELTRNGQPVIVLGYYWWGHAHAGLKLYMRGTPGVFFYVDRHLARDAQGFMAAWRSHQVPILVVGNEGSSELDRLNQFEQAVPQAKRIGFFRKPGGQSSFRVYEVDVADLKSWVGPEPGTAPYPPAGGGEHRMRPLHFLATDTTLGSPSRRPNGTDSQHAFPQAS